MPGVNAANLHALGRCGYGPRQPFVVISPWAKRNFVEHTVTDQTSPLRFIEDNWLGGQRIGQGSFDSIASTITQMFNFNNQDDQDNQGNESGILIVNPNTGQPVQGGQNAQ